jgi:methyltransferase
MVTLWSYTAIIAFVGLERLWELRLSNRNAALAFASGGREAGQGHYRFMTVFHTLFLISCVAEPWLGERPFMGSWILVAAGAQALRYWAISTLGTRWNTRVIVLPEAPPVTGGPYRFVRHPNYVAVVIELFALPLIHGAWITAMVFSIVNAGLLFVRIRVEEEALGPAWAVAFRRPAK